MRFATEKLTYVVYLSAVLFITDFANTGRTAAFKLVHRQGQLRACSSCLHIDVRETTFASNADFQSSAST